ncbi:MAG: TonB-dependent receptor [Bacteroidales bacterium]|nr:TonB-dependent receptor [Candidatus Cryptobacteroides choladohippi]
MTFRKILLTTLCALAGAQLLLAQGISVCGQVTVASDGSPLPGAVVLEKDGTGYAITDLDGRYTISVPSGASLSFTCLGMVEQVIPVNGRTEIDVAMESDTNVLDDVLVVAYGTASKSSFTGSAETIKGEKLHDRPVSDVSRMLDGQVSGVMSTSGSGQPGSGSGIMIRGFGSINASSSPLIVVDGIPYDGNLNSLNPNDIESLSVLKDASAGALYGSRGANGVVIVTTKKGGREDRVSIDFTSRVGFNSMAIRPYETVSPVQYMEQMYRAFYNDLVHTEGRLPKEAQGMTVPRLAKNILGRDNRYNAFDMDVAELFDAKGRIVPEAGLKYDTDWLGAAKAKFPLRQEHLFSMSGASDVSRYMASISYLDENGTIKTTEFRRFTARAGAEFTPYKWLDFGLNANYSNSRSDYLGASGTEANNIWYTAMMMAPIYPVYETDKSGNVIYKDGAPVFDYGTSRPAGAQNNRNCIATLFDDDYYSIHDNVNLRGHLGISVGDFKLSTSVGADIINTYTTTMYNRNNGNAAGTGRLTKESQRTQSYTWNQLLSYRRSFDLHTVDAMAGHEFYSSNARYLVGQRTGFPFDKFDELGLGSTLAEADSSADTYSIDSWLCRANYSFDDKYYLSGSLRTDASSRFRKDNRWGVFWSLGASWRISQESFLADATWLDNMTMKLSYGVQGNDNIGSYYAWQALYDMGYPNASYSGAVIASLENRNVTWEKNGNVNAGLEFKMFSRFSGTVEWYRRTTSDMLLEYPIAISLGFPGYYANVGKMYNTGVDMTFGYDIMNKPDLFWNVSLMGSLVRNRVVSLTGNGQDINNGVYLIREGEPVNTFYMARSAGVDPATGEQLYLAYEKDEKGSRIPGTEYATNDATVASGCKWLCGSRLPAIYGSLSTSLHVKSWDVSALLTYSLGGKIYDSTYRSLMEPSFVGQTYHVNSLRAWQKAGDITDVPKIMTTSTSVINDRYLVDASYLSIKSVSVGYTLNLPVLEKCHIRSARLYASGDNLLMLSALRGLNPQSSFSGSTSYTYTPNRTVSLGIDLKF